VGGVLGQGRGGRGGVRELPRLDAPDGGVDHRVDARAVDQHLADLEAVRVDGLVGHLDCVPDIELREGLDGAADAPRRQDPRCGPEERRLALESLRYEPPPEVAGSVGLSGHPDHVLVEELADDGALGGHLDLHEAQGAREQQVLGRREGGGFLRLVRGGGLTAGVGAGPVPASAARADEDKQGQEQATVGDHGHVAEGRRGRRTSSARPYPCSGLEVNEAPEKGGGKNTVGQRPAPDVLDGNRRGSAASPYSDLGHRHAPDSSRELHGAPWIPRMVHRGGGLRRAGEGRHRDTSQRLVRAPVNRNRRRRRHTPRGAAARWRGS